MKPQILRPPPVCMLLLLWTGMVALPAAHADIYAWTDADGVRHFSNKPPRGRVADVRQSEEIPYDAPGDQRNQEADIRYFDQRAREIANRRQEQNERAQERDRERAREAEARADNRTPNYADEYEYDDANYGGTYYGGGYGGYYNDYDRGRRGGRDRINNRRHRRGKDDHGYRSKSGRYSEDSKEARIRRHRHIGHHRRSKRERGVRSGLTRVVRAVPSPYYMGYRPVYAREHAYESPRGGNGRRSHRWGGGSHRSGGRGRVSF